MMSSPEHGGDEHPDGEGHGREKEVPDLEKGTSFKAKLDSLMMNNRCWFDFP